MALVRRDEMRNRSGQRFVFRNERRHGGGFTRPSHFRRGSVRPVRQGRSARAKSRFQLTLPGEQIPHRRSIIIFPLRYLADSFGFIVELQMIFNGIAAINESGDALCSRRSPARTSAPAEHRFCNAKLAAVVAHKPHHA